MGMYTEIRCDFRLKPDTPEHILETVRFMVGQKWNPDTNDDDQLGSLPDHPLFRCDRWHYMLRSMECFNEAEFTTEFTYEGNGLWHLIVCSGLKNYDGEIGHFFNWIAPYVASSENGLCGSSLYEEFHLERTPDLYFINDGVVTVVPGEELPEVTGPWWR